jgi:hypothetical protein
LIIAAADISASFFRHYADAFQAWLAALRLRCHYALMLIFGYAMPLSLMIFMPPPHFARAADAVVRRCLMLMPFCFSLRHAVAAMPFFMLIYAAMIRFFADVAVFRCR